MRQSPPGRENLAGFFFAAHLLPSKSGRCRASAKAATARSQCLPNSRYWLHPDWAGYWSHTAGRLAPTGVGRSGAGNGRQSRAPVFSSFWL